MNDRIQTAIDMHHRKYNCAQAVVCAYADLFGVDPQVAFAMSEGLGGGIGGSKKSTCGAVTGMALLAGLALSSGDVEKEVTKMHTYEVVQQLTEEFEKKNQSSICSVLFGLDGQPKLRSCDGCIEDACRIIEEKLISVVK